MTDNRLNEPITTGVSSDVREPASMTLADLGWLVVGCAVALSLPWTWYDPDGRYAYEPSRDPIVRLLGIATDVMMKACVGLIPVLLARRARYGGVIGPGELLIFIGAAPQFTYVLDKFAWYGQAWNQRHPGGPSGVPQEAFWVLKVSAIVVLAAVIRSVGRLRNQAPAWHLAVLSGLAVFSLDCGIWDVLRLRIPGSFLLILGPTETVASLMRIAADFPVVCVSTLLVIAMLRSRFEPPLRSRTTWVAWCGLGLTFGLHFWLLATQYHWNLGHWQSGQVMTAYMLQGVFVGQYVIAGIFSWLAIRRLGPACRRWLSTPSRAAR